MWRKTRKKDVKADQNDQNKNLIGNLFLKVAKMSAYQIVKSPDEDKKDKPITLQFSDLASGIATGVTGDGDENLESGGGSSLLKKDPKQNPLQNNL